MPKPKVTKQRTTNDILTDILIVQCAQAGLTNAQIREIAGVDNNRISAIARYFKKAGSNA